MAMARREQIGLAALAVVVAVGVALMWSQGGLRGGRGEGDGPAPRPPGDVGGPEGVGGGGPLGFSGGGGPGASLFDDLEMPVRFPQPSMRPAGPEPRAILPPVPFPGDTVVSVVGIESHPIPDPAAAAQQGGPGFGGAFGLAPGSFVPSGFGWNGGFGPPGAFVPRDALPQADPATQQLVVVRLVARDTQRPDDRDRAVRINGQPARGFKVPNLTGDRWPYSFAVAVVDKSVRRARIEVGVATGPFEEAQRIEFGPTLDLDGALPVDGPAAGRAPLRIRSVGRSDRGRLMVTMTGKPWDFARAAEASWLLTATLREGDVAPTGGMIRPAETPGDFVVSVRTEPEEVARLIYRTRPYEWRTIGELDVPPITVATSDDEVDPRPRFRRGPRPDADRPVEGRPTNDGNPDAGTREGGESPARPNPSRSPFD